MRAYGVLGPDPDKQLFPTFVPATSVAHLTSNVSYEYLAGPIRNQQRQGTCVAFATLGIVNAVLTKRLFPAQPPQMSEAGLYAMTKLNREPSNMQQQGLYVQDALWVLQNLGYVLDKDRPYKDDPLYILEPVPANIVHNDHELKGFQRVGGNELGNDALNIAMQLALYEKGPLAIGIEFQLDWEDVDHTGFLTSQPHRGTAGGHEVEVFGYSMTKRAYRIRNSWGTDWADRGWCWLSFDSVNFIDDVYTIGI